VQATEGSSEGVCNRGLIRGGVQQRAHHRVKQQRAPQRIQATEGSSKDVHSTGLIKGCRRCGRLFESIIINSAKDGSIDGRKMTPY
jgi:hypothetical protein